MVDLVTQTREILVQSDATRVTYALGAISSNGDCLYLTKSTLVLTSAGQRWNSILYRMELSTRELTRLSVIPTYSGTDNVKDLLIEEYADISNDGQYLVFNSNRYDPMSTKSGIYIMDLNDRSIR